jgi:hypothetical protein
MTASLQVWTDHLLRRLAQVRHELGLEPASPGDAHVRLADVLDSMGLIEYLAVLAEDLMFCPLSTFLPLSRRQRT